MVDDIAIHANLLHCRKGHGPTVQLLVDEKMDVNCVDKATGSTVAHGESPKNENLDVFGLVEVFVTFLGSLQGLIFFGIQLFVDFEVVNSAQKLVQWLLPRVAWFPLL